MLNLCNYSARLEIDEPRDGGAKKIERMKAGKAKKQNKKNPDRK
jgi:hypothetical protein